MSKCAGCHSEHEGSGRCCEVCNILIPSLTGQDSAFITDPELVSSVREELGGHGNSISQIWRAVRNMRGYEWEWSMKANPMDDRMWITDRPDPWEIDLGRMDEFYRNEGLVPDVNELRALQRGGCLPDGSYLTWNGGRFYLDGMKIRLPYRGLAKILRSHHGRSDVDYRKLLLSIDLAVRKSQRRGHWGGIRSGNTITHPVLGLLRNGRGNFERMRDRADFRIIQQHDRARMRFFEDSEWMRRWHEQFGRANLPYLSKRDFEVPRTMTIRNGRLQLKVRRNSGWRSIELDSDPALWSRVVTWALSPPEHNDRRRLHCIQQHVFVDPGMPLISGSELRGVGFLRKIVEDNDRAQIDEFSKSITVTGTSGLSYRVTPTLKGDGARFTVRPYDPDRGQLDEANPRWRHQMNSNRLCIVELPELRKLVLGDAVATVVMALLDDINSQRHIHTLKMHVNGHIHRERDGHLRAVNEVRMLRERLERNDLQMRIRRFTVLLPRLWGVLLRRPLGERMTFTAINRGRPNVSFDGCDTQFETSSMVERRALYAMLEASGWIRDREEEAVRGNPRMYMRTGTGERDTGREVERFCEDMTGAIELGNGIRVIPEPLWTFYERENPGIAELLPGTDQLIR